MGMWDVVTRPKPEKMATDMLQVVEMVHNGLGLDGNDYHHQ